MMKQTGILLGFVGLIGAVSLPVLAQATTQHRQLKQVNLAENPNVIAQTRPVPAPQLEGRGVAHGSVVTTQP